MVLNQGYWPQGLLTPPSVDNDGWEHTEATDLFTVHDYAPRGDQLEAHWAAFPQGAVEQEISGLMTYDRKPKIDPEKIKKLQP